MNAIDKSQRKAARVAGVAFHRLHRVPRNKVVNDWLFDTPMGVFELALGFWLLFKGLKE